MGAKSNLLEAVLLEPTARQSAAAEVLFGSLESLLVDKYGKPSYQSREAEPDKRIGRSVVLEGIKNYKTKWVFSSTIITLSYLEMRSINLYKVRIIYKKRTSEDSQKL